MKIPASFIRVLRSTSVEKYLKSCVCIQKKARFFSILPIITNSYITINKDTSKTLPIKL